MLSSAQGHHPGGGGGGLSYSPPPPAHDFAFDVGIVRQPLGESSGNAQSAVGRLGALSSLYPLAGLGSATVAPSSMAVPHPILPSQAEDVAGGRGGYRTRSHHHLAEGGDEQLVRGNKRVKFRRHPFFTVREFSQYREKQKNKEEKDKVWPEVLEIPLLDGELFGEFWKLSARC